MKLLYLILSIVCTLCITDVKSKKMSTNIRQARLWLSCKMAGGDCMQTCAGTTELIHQTCLIARCCLRSQCQSKEKMCQGGICSSNSTCGPDYHSVSGGCEPASDDINPRPSCFCCMPDCPVKPFSQCYFYGGRCTKSSCLEGENVIDGGCTSDQCKCCVKETSGPDTTTSEPTTTTPQPTTTDLTEASTALTSTDSGRIDGDRKKPGGNKKIPGSNKKKPGTNKKKPGTNKKKPGSNKKNPGSNKNKPGINKKKPVSSKNKPGSIKKNH